MLFFIAKPEKLRYNKTRMKGEYFSWQKIQKK